MSSTQDQTAHEVVRRLQASVKDLQNALRVSLKIPAPVRPARASLLSASTTEAGASNSSDPYTRILANNDRGVVRDIQANKEHLTTGGITQQRLQDIGVAVIGLDGVGRLVAEIFVRYGVQHLVLADSSEITDGDLDGMSFQAEDVGWCRDERLAMTLRRLNPDVQVASLALSPRHQSAIVEALRRKLVPTSGKDHLIETQENPGDEDVDAVEAENDGERDDEPVKPLHVVFLCANDGEQLVEALNELCCEFGLLLVTLSVGVDGMSGESVLAAPGVSSCLQCLQKRMVRKAPPPNDTAKLSSVKDVAPRLPSTDCILAGLSVQNALMHLLGFGHACSRLEYDGFLEELVRSELLPPVHQCPSATCRQQQMRHHHHHQQASPLSTVETPIRDQTTPTL